MSRLHAAGSARLDGGQGQLRGVVWIPTRPVGGSEQRKETERGRARSTYDKVDGLGETPVSDRAERTRLLVRDTLGMVRMSVSVSVEDGGDGIP